MLPPFVMDQIMRARHTRRGRRRIVSFSLEDFGLVDQRAVIAQDALLGVEYGLGGGGGRHCSEKVVRCWMFDIRWQESKR